MTSRRTIITPTRSALAAIVLSSATLALAGCPIPVPDCTQNLAFSFEAEYEDCGTGALCGFTATSGTITPTTTLHDGEHGMLLAAGTTARVSFSTSSSTRGSETLTIIARCDDGTSLSATEEITTPVGPRRVALTIPATTHWVNHEITFFDSGTSNTGSTTTVRPDALVLSVAGAGSCAVDSVHYQVNALACRISRDAGFDSRDARSDARRDGTFGDAPTDVAGDALPAATLFSTCASAADCTALGPSAACLTEFADGVCTRGCTTDADCGDGTTALCLGDVCIPRCTSGDGRCDVFGASCVMTDANDPTRGTCRPSCFPSTGTPPSATFHTCATCNLWTGTCGGTDPAGAVNGAACLQDSDCRGSFCIPESDAASGTPTGFASGYCASVGFRIDDSAYTRGASLPQGNCPEGSAPYPFDGTSAGAATLCFATCDDANPCRSGYECDRFRAPSDGSAYFANGFCLPASCATSGASGCASGFGCGVARAGGGTLCASSL